MGNVPQGPKTVLSSHFRDCETNGKELVEDLKSALLKLGGSCAVNLLVGLHGTTCGVKKEMRSFKSVLNSFLLLPV